MTRSPRTIIVLAKAPRPGMSKTRLCPPCTPEDAAGLAAAALADTLAAVVAADVERRVVVLDGPPGHWLPAGVEVLRQRPGSLGDRLAGAYADVLGDSIAPTLLVGMDTPQLSASDFDSALRELVARPSGAVLGDAADGGWWAIGLHRSEPTAYDGVPMSRHDTARHQRRRLAELGLAVTDLPVLRDVDVWADAVAVAGMCRPESNFAAAVDALVVATSEVQVAQAVS